MSNSGFWAKQSTEQRKLLNLIRKQNSLIKKALKPLAKPLLAKVRANVPVDSGALKKSLGHKEIAKNGKSAAIVIGPRSNYVLVADSKTVSQDAPTLGVVKTPRSYARFVELREPFLASALTGEELTKLQANIQAAIDEVLKQ